MDNVPQTAAPAPLTTFIDKFGVPMAFFAAGFLLAKLTAKRSSN